MVSEIHDNVNMMTGIKNVYEMEGVISPRDSCIDFLNGSILFFPMTDVLLKPREQRFIKIDVPFINEICRLAMIKLLYLKTGATDTIKVKFMRNAGFLDVTNNSSETLMFSRDEALNQRSIGHYKVKQSVI